MLSVSLDTETTGLDLRHGARPFFVTSTNVKNETTFWEWEVDVKTRQPLAPRAELIEVRDLIRDADEIILQNCKYDYLALTALFADRKIKFDWDWSKIQDTLLAAHMLASNQPKDLTALALIYLEVDILPYEKAVSVAATKARSIARRKDFIAKHGEWRIAKKGLPEMPSAKEKVHKNDMWLPRQIAEALGYADDHPWRTVTAEYGNTDSAVTGPIFRVQKKILEERDLWKLYVERQKLLRVIANVEERGVSLSKKRLRCQYKQYATEAQAAETECKTIAKKHRVDLLLPKSGTNKAMSNFLFDRMKLPIIARTKTGAPCFDKNVIQSYLLVLDPKSDVHRFLSLLSGKRKRDTACSYMSSYQRFWLPGEGTDYALYPSLNPTGTATLRMSSQNPNEQNISKGNDEDFNLRWSFGPGKGREWWSIDFENQELRIPAYESGEKAMIEIFERPNDAPYFGSYHLLNASIIYPDEFWPLAEQEGAFKKKYKGTLYQWVKNFGFAVGYGAVLQSGTADRAAHKTGAQAMVMNKLKEHSKLNTKWVEFAKKHGYVETMPDREIDPKHGYQLWCTRTRWGGILETVPLNYHVQGTACWVTTRAMVKIQEYLDTLNSKLPKPEYFMVMNVHDEIVFDFPAKPNHGNKPIIRKVKGLMEGMGDAIGVPFTCSVDYHENNWADGEKVHFQTV